MKVPLDDFYDVAAFGLIKAAETYISKNEFSTYAIKVICNKIKDEIKKTSKKVNETSLDALLEFEDNIDLKTYVPDIASDFFERIEIDFIKEKLGSQKYSHIIDLMLEGYNQKEIADKLHISQRSVVNSKKNIRNILRNMHFC